MAAKQSLRRNTERGALTWVVTLGLLAAAVALTLYGAEAMPIVSRPATGQAASVPLPPQLRGAVHYLRAHTLARLVWPEPAALDAGQQGTLNYIRVHAAVWPGPAQAALDPAAQSILNYVRAHEPARPAVDPAMQSVLNYIRVHEFDRPSQATLVDPNTQSVLDYLRAHGQLP